MELPASVFDVIDWATIVPTLYPGATGTAAWRTRELGTVRMRMVEYSPNYLADHWCDRGHILFVIEGELTSELRDGRVHKLHPGMSYQVSNFGDSAHRSRSTIGAKLFIVD